MQNRRSLKLCETFSLLVFEVFLKQSLPYRRIIRTRKKNSNITFYLSHSAAFEENNKTFLNLEVTFDVLYFLFCEFGTIVVDAYIFCRFFFNILLCPLMTRERNYKIIYLHGENQQLRVLFILYRQTFLPRVTSLLNVH